MTLAKQGIDVRQTTGHLAFRAFLQDSLGAIVTSGTTSLYLYELQSDGTLKSYDWSDNTFKTLALTTETQALTHRTGNNNGTNTGIWTYALTTLTGFTKGGIYFARVKNVGATPTDQMREFQFGLEQGDNTADFDSSGCQKVDAIRIGDTLQTGGNLIAVLGAPSTSIAADIATRATDIGVATQITTDHGSGSYIRNTEPPTTVQNAVAVYALADAIEPGETAQQTHRAIRAAALGKTDGFPNGPGHFRNKADTVDVITVTLDGDGNRSVIVVNFTY